MARHAVVVMGASAGGLQAITTIIERLPSSLQACVLVVIHASSDGRGILPQLLDRVSALPVAFASHGDELHSGRIYVAPPNVHLLIAVRVLEEHANLKSGMAKRAADGGMKKVSEGFTEGARDAHDQAPAALSAVQSGKRQSRRSRRGEYQGAKPLDARTLEETARTGETASAARSETVMRRSWTDDGFSVEPPTRDTSTSTRPRSNSAARQSSHRCLRPERQ